MTIRRGLVFLFFLLLSAQALSEATAQEDWTGDLGAFVFDGGELRLREGGFSGEARLTKDFSGISGETEVPSLYWRTVARFTDRPSSLNRFEWTLFSIESETGTLEKYILAPSTDGRRLELSVRSYSDLSEKNRLGTSFLESLEILQPSVAWQNLVIEAYLVPEEGLSFSLRSEVQSLTTSYPFPLEHGQMRKKMQFFVKATALMKKAYVWDVPTVGSLSQKREPLKYEEVRISGENEILVRLNKPVSIGGAIVSAPGFAPTLTQIEPDLLSINLGKSPEAEGEIVIEIRGLKDSAGVTETISITLEAYSDEKIPGGGARKPQEPAGIYLSEIMVDPPASGLLHGLKYVEIYNGTDTPVMPSSLLLRYRTQHFRLHGEVIPPRGYALILPAGTILSAPGTKIYLDNFPALSGDFSLKLFDLTTETELDSYYFSARSYEPGRSKAGVSVERVSFVPSLWRTSSAEEGGTPGRGTSMLPYEKVPEGGIVLNEFFLSSKGKKQRYIELYNSTQSPISTSDLYLAYRDKSSKKFTPIRLSDKDARIPPQGYLVIVADADAFGNAFPNPDRTLISEKIDFPTLSEAYSEIELRGYRDNRLIDHAVYRKNWLGGKERSLERLFPPKDGAKRSSWGISAVKGTPTKKNAPTALSPDAGQESAEWPEDPIISFGQLTSLLPLHRDRVSLLVETLLGQKLAESKGMEAEQMLREIRSGSAPLPSGQVVVRVLIRHPDEDPLTPELTPPLSYTGIWQHIAR